VFIEFLKNSYRNVRHRTGHCRRRLPRRSQSARVSAAFAKPPLMFAFLKILFIN
jgi:hypothetical protein